MNRTYHNTGLETAIVLSFGVLVATVLIGGGVLTYAWEAFWFILAI